MRHNELSGQPIGYLIFDCGHRLVIFTTAQPKSTGKRREARAGCRYVGATADPRSRRLDIDQVGLKTLREY